MLGLAAVTGDLLLVVLWASPAFAHAAIVSSDPEPGAVLSAVPGVVTLEFTEPLNQDLSTASVTAPDGGRSDGRVQSTDRITISLSTNAPGVYRVEWKTVSILDGHPLAGSFAFGVGVSPGSAGEGIVTAGPDRSTLSVGLLRAIEYLALLISVGMLLLERLARREPRQDWVRPRLRLALVAALIAGTAVVGGEVVLAAGSLSGRAIVAYLTTGLAGWARLARLGAEAAALVAALLGGGTVAVPVALALVALASAGHAAAVDPRWLGISVDAIHLAAAGLWAGGILALATVRPPGGWRTAPGRSMLDRFTPVAIPAFLVTVAAGVLRGLEELTAPADLFRTSYGLTLTLKVAAVLVMAQLSILAWRRVIGSFRAEAVVAILVVGLAALLAAYPLPPARTAEAGEAAAPSGAEMSGLPESGDLTLGGSAGQVLVGLTIRPALPGSNETLVYLLPLEGEAAAAGLSATIKVDEGPGIQMEDCGATCRRGELELAGGEEISVQVGGSVGGTAVFRLPELPAPDGTALLRRAQKRIHELRSYRENEILSSGLAHVRSSYAFVAPDRARIDVDGGSSSVFIGSTRYLRSAPDGTWDVTSGAPPLSVPLFVWDSFRPWMDARVMGMEKTKGEETTVISFFGSAGNTPAWFKLWVAPDGLVLRAEMRAQGHFMDERYFDFDGAIAIRPPSDASE